MESPTSSSSAFPVTFFTRWPTITFSQEVPIRVTADPARGVSATLVTIPAIPVGRVYSKVPETIPASSVSFSASEAAYTWLRSPDPAAFDPTAKIIANAAQALRATKLCMGEWSGFSKGILLSSSVVTSCKLLFNFIFFFPCTFVMFWFLYFYIL